MKPRIPSNIGAFVSVGALALALAFAPLTRAETLYLARAIGEPAVPEARPPINDATPELPGLGTDNPPPAAPAENSSTWKWVAGIALTVALVALAKGGGGDSGGTSSTGGGSGGGGGGGGGNDSDDDERDGRRGGLPSLPVLPGGR